MGIMIVWKECAVMPKHILNQKPRLNLKRILEVQVKRVPALVSETDRFALYF
ncbi:uncharacterized protein G2W53_007614 [Senna tora]|uniref:Uncharacterized protein n=1 Tax=Senna tora TaxID=362788 RepID=A0A835CHE9_9FABA|nr:uncharacterized protein G2W53_007614 [Senna tora]